MNFSQIMDLTNYEGTKIVTVGLVSGGFLLSGKRRDNGLWTNPGGHVDEGEDILSAAIREVKEEAGIDINSDQIELIYGEKVTSHRTGKPFVVFGFLAHVDKETATAKNDPDKEISEWRWVPLDKSQPELQREARHAKEDCVLIHLGIHSKGAKMSRTMEEVSKDIQTANVDESGHSQAEPKPKTPEQMKNDPEAYLDDENATGD